MNTKIRSFISYLILKIQMVTSEDWPFSFSSHHFPNNQTESIARNWVWATASKPPPARLSLSKVQRKAKINQILTRKISRIARRKEEVVDHMHCAPALLINLSLFHHLFSSLTPLTDNVYRVMVILYSFRQKYELLSIIDVSLCLVLSLVSQTIFTA